jgi:DNA invertase Pin-like site-specific DNA recombinase
MALRGPRGRTGAPPVPRFVSYIRVSTGKQAIGPEAQRQAVAGYVAAAGGDLVAEFSEIETGTNKRRRPEMAAALAACRVRRATLIIAKLDRLARNVYFISGLMESGVAFVACDNPHATPLTIQILAAVAENEAKAISQRTIDALAVVRRELAANGSWLSRRSGNRITRLGNPRLQPGSARLAHFARQARSKRALEYAAAAHEYIAAARNAGCNSLGEIAKALTARGIETPSGGRQWYPSQVGRIVRRLANQKITDAGTPPPR